MPSEKPQPVQTTQTSSSAPWGPQGDKLQIGYDEALKIYRDPNNPTFFPSATFAPTDAATTAGLNAAETEANRTIAGDYLDPSKNSGLRNLIDATMARSVPGAMAPFISAGRSGSGLASRALGEGVAAGVAPLYQAERDRMSMAPGQLAAVGGAREAIAQRGIDEDMARHEFNTNLPQNKLANYMQMLQGNWGGTNTSTGTQFLPGVNPWMQALGLISNAAGTAAGIYAKSDIRTKEDIKRVGETDDGLGVYTFRYKGESEFMPMRIGVMAQEVAMVKPEAVTMLPDGYYGVDYTKVG